VRRLAIVVLIAAYPVAAFAAPPPGLSIAVSGPVTTVFDHGRDACAQWDIPDAPARAIRAASGSVLLFAPHFRNMLLRGADLLHVRPDCHMVFAGAEADDPAAFDDRAWLTAPFTRDGTNIFVVVHDEFQGHRRPALCPSGRYIDCWYNALTLAVSHDGGMRFVGAGLVAALPYRYDEVTGSHRGYFNPSNIVTFGGYQFMMTFATDARAQRAGNCLLRTDRPEDPQSWRGWDGAAFTVRFINPYTEHDAPGAHVCAPVGDKNLIWPVTSLVRHSLTGLFIATMMNAAPDGGVFYATSADLVSWSPPAWLPLGLGETGWHCTSGAPFAYPSMLDPASDDRSFATIGNTPVLFLTRFHMPDCDQGPDRDLIRLPLAIRVG
jgi:hypothetical protein